jgi:hypothetical protein
VRSQDLFEYVRPNQKRLSPKEVKARMSHAAAGGTVFL